jgi:hypothetical protein
VASEFGEDARRPEVDKTTGAVDSCPQSWQLLRRATESEGKSQRCGGKREPRGARQGGGGLRRVNPLRLPGKGGKYDGSTRSGVQLTDGEDFYRAELIRWPRRPAINGDGPPATSKGWDLFQFNTYCTMASHFS